MKKMSELDINMMCDNEFLNIEYNTNFCLSISYR